MYSRSSKGKSAGASEYPLPNRSIGLPVSQPPSHNAKTLTKQHHPASGTDKLVCHAAERHARRANAMYQQHLFTILWAPFKDLDITVRRADQPATRERIGRVRQACLAAGLGARSSPCDLVFLARKLRRADEPQDSDTRGDGGAGGHQDTRRNQLTQRLHRVT